MDASAYIRSIKNVVLALGVLTATSAYLTYENSVSEQHLGQYVLLESIIDVIDAVDNGRVTGPLDGAALALVSFDAQWNVMRHRLRTVQFEINGKSFSSGIFDYNRRFYDVAETSIKNGYLVHLSPSRLKPRIPCVATKVQGPPAESALVLTGLADAFSGTLPMSEIFLITFSYRCLANQLGLNDITILKENNTADWLVGIPSSLAQSFDFDRSEIFFLFPFHMDQLKYFKEIPSVLRTYMSLTDVYYLFPVQYFEDIVFQKAAQLTGHYRPVDDLQGALGDVAVQVEPTASIFGLSASFRVFVFFFPILCSGLVFLLDHRLKYLCKFNLTSREPWLILDAWRKMEKLEHFPITHGHTLRQRNNSGIGPA